MSEAASPLTRQATCVAIGGHAILIEGEPGSGKSSLALALIDRGAQLIGDDGVLLTPAADRLLAAPHPNTRGLIEIRNLGILTLPVADPAPVALVLHLDESAPRFIEGPEQIEIAGISLPLIRLWPGGALLHLKAEWALTHHGLFRS